MARFILDINTDNTLEATRKIMVQLIEDSEFDTASVTCVNVSNDTQFHCEVSKNALTEAEVQKFNDMPHG